MNKSSSPENPINRRKLLRRLGSLAVVAYSVPAVTMLSAAHASSGASSPSKASSPSVASNSSGPSSSDDSQMMYDCGPNGVDAQDPTRCPPDTSQSTGG